MIDSCDRRRAAAPRFTPKPQPRALAFKAARAYLQRQHAGQRTSYAKVAAEFGVRSTRSVFLAVDELLKSGTAVTLVEGGDAGAPSATVTAPEAPKPLEERRKAAYALAGELYAGGKGKSARTAAAAAALAYGMDAAPSKSTVAAGVTVPGKPGAPMVLPPDVRRFIGDAVRLSRARKLRVFKCGVIGLANQIIEGTPWQQHFPKGTVGEAWYYNSNVTLTCHIAIHSHLCERITLKDVILLKLLQK